jgi:hypothetical protein
VGLWRSRPMHGLCGEGRNGVSASFDAERGRDTKESGGGHRRLLTKRKMGNGGGGGLQPMLYGRAAPAASQQRRVWVGVVACGSRGMGWRVWAARERVGRPGEGRRRAETERTVLILI